MACPLVPSAWCDRGWILAPDYSDASIRARQAHNADDKSGACGHWQLPQEEFLVIKIVGQTLNDWEQCLI